MQILNKLGLTRLRSAAILGLGAISTAGTASADSAASAWAKTDHTQVRLVSASATTGDGPALRLGMQFKLQPGWKVYWRSPGDAGFPPHIDWKGSINLTNTKTEWPAPKRFSVLGLETLGYKDEVILPLSAKTVTPSQGASLKARVRYLTCNDICIPYEAKLSLELPPGPMTPSAHAHSIDRYSARVPGDGAAHGLAITDLRSVEKAGKSVLRLVASAEGAFTAPDAFMEGVPGLAYGKPNINLSDDGRRAIIDIAVDGLDGLDDAKGQTLDDRTFTVTLIDGKRTAEQQLTAKPGDVALDSGASNADQTAHPATGPPSLWTILLFAILGGLILNLMPCVLPVLSLKLLSLVQHGGGEPADVRMGFLASAAGIITACLALAGVLAAMKAAGSVVGWGIQFQQPWFLIGLITLVTVFACNLWGFFEVRLPAFIGNAGTGHAEGVGGHFLQGVFATLLATPCSAPFLGTAIGFALAGATADIFMVFAALGVGLALPYLAVATVPGLATRLPKPGTWMVKLRVVLGFALAATAIWLLTVLAGTSGADAALVTGALMGAAAMVLFVAHRPTGRGLKASAPALAGTFILALMVPSWLPAPATNSKTTALDGIWQPFNEAAIPKLVAEGKTVYVDVTADWCLTCLVNKGVVLSDTRVQEILADKNVVAMIADWTKPNEAISRYLARYGRYGIPFNIVYGPKMPDGVVLPELLRPGLVLDAFGQAADIKILTTSR